MGVWHMARARNLRGRRAGWELGNEAVDEFGKMYSILAYWASGVNEWRLLDRASGVNFGPIGLFGLFLIDARINYINLVLKYFLPKFPIGLFDFGQFGFGLGFFGFGFWSSVFMPTPS
jgi:hypothetical protein